jgi:ribosome-binding protein aMBF1 (putative translation factor)
MEYCFRCGIPENEAPLFSTLHAHSIFILCEKCAAFENAIIVKRPTTMQLKEMERKQSVYERMLYLSGLKGKEEHAPQQNSQDRKKLQHDVTLKDLIAKKIQIPETSSISPSSLHLIDNFHWEILMARRSKHLTQKQLAQSIGESEAVIKMVEQGKLPEDAKVIISKLEQFLQVPLLKSSIGKFSHRSSLPKSASSSYLADRHSDETDLYRPVSSQFHKQNPEKQKPGMFDNKPFDKVTLTDLYERKKKRDEEKKNTITETTTHSISSSFQYLPEGISEDDVEEALLDDDLNNEDKD